MEIQPAGEGDREFLVEMARLASGLDDRPLPSAGDPAVLALLPSANDLALVAFSEGGERLGAAWWHFHDPALVADERGQALPEITMAVRHEIRGSGVGGRLLDRLAGEAAERFGAVALNVHMRNPAARLYMRSGFQVAGKGRGWYGVAMVRTLTEQ